MARNSHRHVSSKRGRKATTNENRELEELVKKIVKRELRAVNKIKNELDL